MTEWLNIRQLMVTLGQFDNCGTFRPVQSKLWLILLMSQVFKKLLLLSEQKQYSSSLSNQIISPTIGVIVAT